VLLEVRDYACVEFLLVDVGDVEELDFEVVFVPGCGGAAEAGDVVA
jgi:hypothetical protein